VPKLVWRVKLVAELRPGVMTETEVARIERDEQTGLADLGLRLDEAKQLIRFPVDQTGIAGLGHQWKFVPGLS